MRLKLKNVKLIKQVQDREKYRSSGQQQAEATPSETIDIEEVFEEEHPLHAWVNTSTSVEPEFDPHDRAWAEGELDDVPLLPEFETPPAPKRQKKTVGAGGRSKKHGISIADLETIEEDIDDETSDPSDNVVYQTSNDSTSKTSTPSEGSDHGGDVLVVNSVPPPAPPPDAIVFTGEEDFTYATQDQHHGSRQGREAQTSSQQYARKGKKVASQLQGQGQGQGASEDSGYNPNFIPHRRNWLMKKKKMQEDWERQEKLRMEFETMEQASDTSSYASTEGYYQGQGGYLGYPQYPDASGAIQPPLPRPNSTGLGPARPSRGRDRPVGPGYYSHGCQNLFGEGGYGALFWRDRWWGDLPFCEVFSDLFRMAAAPLIPVFQVFDTSLPGRVWAPIFRRDLRQSETLQLQDLAGTSEPGTGRTRSKSIKDRSDVQRQRHPYGLAMGFLDFQGGIPRVEAPKSVLLLPPPHASPFLFSVFSSLHAFCPASGPALSFVFHLPNR
ncbi:hypothetical protein Taro_036306 [Colocasia esculenta]|uniref:Uncharacterized protein n=1 Tax=Colocasia esculenta TaxID=4460 RepID=A0A843W826_COLES|nr:hypothetical protein [Colocasia esculenta]